MTTYRPLLIAVARFAGGSSPALGFTMAAVLGLTFQYMPVIAGKNHHAPRKACLMHDGGQQRNRIQIPVDSHLLGLGQGVHAQPAACATARPPSCAASSSNASTRLACRDWFTASSSCAKLRGWAKK